MGRDFADGIDGDAVSLVSFLYCSLLRGIISREEKTLILEMIEENALLTDKRASC